MKKRAHINMGLGGRDKMVKALSGYKNATHDIEKLIKSMCSMSKETEKMYGQGCYNYTNMSKDFASRAQVDLVDMQSCAKEKYNWIMVYQDHLTQVLHFATLNFKKGC